MLRRLHKNLKYALSVRVHDMDVNDATKIVTSVLNRYNKKLTTNDDSFLGNQISSLINKNIQPLFLTAATQAILIFGVFEKLSEFIEDLPNEVPSLFEIQLEKYCLFRRSRVSLVGKFFYKCFLLQISDRNTHI